jgi:hypothetical protein
MKASKYSIFLVIIDNPPASGNHTTRPRGLNTDDGN